MSLWERLILLVLAVALLAILGAGVAALWALRQGIPIRVVVSGAIDAKVEPTEVSLRLEGPVEIVVQAPEGGLSAKVEGALFPKCEEGVLIPVRWNPLTGEVTWKCVPQEKAQPQGQEGSP